MKNLFQLKKRITWEIQALKDRRARIAATLAVPEVHHDPRLFVEHAAIERQIKKLEELGMLRRLARKLCRALPHIEHAKKNDLKKELTKVGDRVRTLRIALAM